MALAMARGPLLVVALVAFLSAWVSPLQAARTERPVATDNRLVVQQYKMENVRGLLPGSSARQAVYCWQIAGGTWNGQPLGGVAVVLVQEVSEDGQARQAAIYVSDFASPEQRKAAVAALTAASPALFPERNSAAQRIEPAVIRLEQVDDQTVILHLGLIA